MNCCGRCKNNEGTIYNIIYDIYYCKPCKEELELYRQDAKVILRALGL